MQNLARIDWKMGQTLLPAHFFAQEEALVADSAARFGMVAFPWRGSAGSAGTSPSSTRGSCRS